MPSSDPLNLSSLKPAQPRVDRKRVGRGLGSGKGRYSGRGIKGQKSRSGSAKMRPGFEGGQNPIHMRLGKLRGPYSRDAMPMGPHRTFTQAVNLRDLEARFDAGADVTLEALQEKGLIKNTKTDVKILASGDLTKKLSVTAHRFSAAAKEKIEAAGGTVTALREPTTGKTRKRRLRKGIASASGQKPPAARDEPAEEAEVEATEEADAAEATDEES
jgi:large subunit ribosomal protein L15